MDRRESGKEGPETRTPLSYCTILYVLYLPAHDVGQVRVVDKMHRTSAVRRELIPLHKTRVTFAERSIGHSLASAAAAGGGSWGVGRESPRER